MDVVPTLLTAQEAQLAVLATGPEELVGVVDARQQPEGFVGHVCPSTPSRWESPAPRASRDGRGERPRGQAPGRTTAASAGWRRRCPPTSPPPRRQAWRGVRRPAGCAG